MKVVFDQLPNEAKVWMYQAPQAFSAEQLMLVEQFSEVFLSQWESHGIPVQGSIDVIDGQFIRVAAYTDEPSMCGRAQDAQVRLVKELEGELNCELTNRMMLAFDAGDTQHVVHMNDVESLVKDGVVTAETTFYNNIIQSKEEFSTNWKVEAGASWLSRYF